MAKLQKRPPETMSMHAASFYTSSRPSQNPTRSSWDIWYPSSSSQVTSQVENRSTSSSLISRTMSYARTQIEAPSRHDRNLYSATNQVSVSNHPLPVVTSGAHSAAYFSNQTSPITSCETVPSPQRDVERYWAYRAIVAETKLAERMGLRTDELERMKEELRWQAAADVTSKYHEERVLQLERLAIGLISTIVLITLILLFRHNSPSADKHPKRAFRPHLTIPILSPFTSIVEHEDSKFSFRTTAVFLIVLGVLAYGMFRHWLHRRPR